MKLSELTKIVAEYWPNDPSSPSVTVSWLAKRGVYYVSVCRYMEPLGEGKVVYCKATNADLDAAIDQVANTLQATTPKPDRYFLESTIEEAAKLFCKVNGVERGFIDIERIYDRVIRCRISARGCRDLILEQQDEGIRSTASGTDGSGTAGVW